MKRLAVALCLLCLAGCGGSSDGGEATLWVTRDHGAEVVLSGTVPSGLTAMQALERKASVDTAYGGRFVDGIEGVENDEGARQSWFYFVNGIEADRGAAEYTVRPGDVIWWDYRSWRGQEMRHPVVVGAFPEPFVHGYAGRVRSAVVRYWPKSQEALALGLANAIGARSVEPASVPAPPNANVLRLVNRQARFSAAPRSPSGDAGDPIVFTISVDDGKRLLAHPDLAEHRYEGLAP